MNREEILKKWPLRQYESGDYVTILEPFEEDGKIYVAIGNPETHNTFEIIDVTHNTKVDWTFQYIENNYK